MKQAYFFDSEARVNALRAELQNWADTPFVRHMGASARPKVGADCVSFVGHALLRLGAIPAFTWPKYVVSGGGEAMLELLVRTLAAIPELERVQTILPGDELVELRVGDVLLGSSGRALHHLAIYAGDNTLWHSLEKLGVCTGNLHDPIIRKNLRAVYRVRYPKPAVDLRGVCKTCNN